MKRNGIRALIAAATMAAVSSPLLAQSQGIGVYDADGWTVLTPSADTRFIFVSSSLGDDVNDGLSPDRPKRTLDNARRQVRSGHPDWVLLRRGDEWNEQLRWGVGGRSNEEPMVVGAWGPGDERPVIRPPVETGGFYIGSSNLSYLAIVGIEFRAADFTSQTGVRIISDRGDGLLLEDCAVIGFKDNISIIGKESAGGYETVQVRRCVVADSRSPGGHSQGFYGDWIGDLTIEGCVFDHNGWDREGFAPPTIFNHNVYVQSTCGPAVVRDNIIAQGSSHGLQLRPGGVAENNLFLANALAMHTSRSESTVRRNVVLYGRDIDGSNPRGFGIEIKPIVGGVVEQNVIAHRTAASSDGYAFQLHNSDTGITNFNVTVSGNVVYDWGSTALNIRHPDLGIYERIEVRDNTFVLDQGAMVRYAPAQFDRDKFVFSGNQYTTGTPSGYWFWINNSAMDIGAWRSASGETGAASVVPPFPDPDRTVETYWTDIIGEAGGFEEFMDRARTMSRGRWDRRMTAGAVNDYIRAGFGITGAQP
ncbi:MAG: right-handed parallel beta-helix repeat-containing protein [Phycisphaerales bacterium]